MKYLAIIQRHHYESSDVEFIWAYNEDSLYINLAKNVGPKRTTPDSSQICIDTAYDILFIGKIEENFLTRQTNEVTIFKKLMKTELYQDGLKAVLKDVARQEDNRLKKEMRKIQSAKDKEENDYQHYLVLKEKFKNRENKCDGSCYDDHCEHHAE